MEALRICHPGRHGDLLWALPTVRHLAQDDCPVTLIIPRDVAGLLPLLQQQDYIQQVDVDPDWVVQDIAPRQPRYPTERDPVYPPNRTDQPPRQAPLLSLGYAQWPTYSLPYEAAELGGLREYALANDSAFFRPWIQVTGTHQPWNCPAIAVCWTDRYFELKLGILQEIRRCLPQVRLQWFAPYGSRMADAGAASVDVPGLAQALPAVRGVLTDCSMVHVLACAMGLQTLVVEPEHDRHHWIFWPGIDDGEHHDQPWRQRDTVLGRRICPVLGNDGRPTFDSRHVMAELQRLLEAV
jgi:hypothetical protein